MKKYHISLFFITVLFHFSCIRQQPSKILINQNWEFSQSNDTSWFVAEVPGFVHTDLLNSNLIDDPYFGENEKKLQWISKKDWIYRTSFFVDDDLVSKQNMELVFKGLDCYADIYLNNHLLLSTDNMFREWVIDIKDHIHLGNNDLIVEFISALKMDSIKAKEVSYKLPEERGFSRKAPYQNGWDWGPTFITSGVWKDVFIRTWNDSRIENIQIIQDSITNDTAWCHGVFEINSNKVQDAILSVIDENGNSILNKTRVELKEGLNFNSLYFAIEDVELWWPNGLGEQHLYDLKFRMQTQATLDEKIERIGIRRIELVKQPDSIGESFYFLVNDVPVFMKGANYIPQDNFPSRVAKEKYQNLLQSAVDANMNMLRVWGGGIYEDDVFYEICDELGILIWQDFMFACNMYPGDDAFIENVKEEAIHQLKRIRNHPSIALWCGNNEVNEAWHNWGWQNSLDYSIEDSTEVWNNYLKLFEEVLPDVISKYDADRSYVPSSPQIGWGHEEALFSGDMHYWGVWWGEEPFEKYEEKVGRFMSEYGFQGFPNIKTLKNYLDSSDLNLNSQALKNHQKHPRGMELIQQYMEKEYLIPTKFEDYIYVSQILQAYGMTTAIEAHRRAKPVCMGTLYWQLNDCWPVVSWSGIDYEGRWKALHYFTKKAYDEYLVSFTENEGNLDVYLISDKLENDTANLVIQLQDFDGGIIWEDFSEVLISGNSSTIVNQLNIADLIGENNQKQILLYTGLEVDDQIIAENMYYFDFAKELRLEKPQILYEISESENGTSILISTDKLAKNVFLSVEGDGRFSDNYFDLLPGKPKLIEFICKEAGINIKDLKIISLFDTYSLENEN
jgi:beta-mannosidase